MQLIELLTQAVQWEGDAGTIYVKHPWSSDAEAILVNPAPNKIAAVEQAGKTYDYFLEAFIAQEFLNGFIASAEGTASSDRQRCERLISYARNDA